MRLRAANSDDSGLEPEAPFLVEVEEVRVDDRRARLDDHVRQRERAPEHGHRVTAIEHLLLSQLGELQPRGADDRRGVAVERRGDGAGAEGRRDLAQVRKRLPAALGELSRQAARRAQHQERGARDDEHDGDDRRGQRPRGMPRPPLGLAHRAARLARAIGDGFSGVWDRRQAATPTYIVPA